MAGVGASGGDAGSRSPCVKPEDPDELQGMAKADADWGDPSTVGDARHRKADEVVADGEPPDFLRNARGSLAAQRLHPFQRVVFHFIKANLEFAAFVVESDDFGSGVSDRIEQRGVERAHPQAPALISNRADAKGGGQVGSGVANFVGLLTGNEIDKVIVRSQRLEHTGT